jgi:hypothetical protein
MTAKCERKLELERGMVLVSFFDDDDDDESRTWQTCLAENVQVNLPTDPINGQAGGDNLLTAADVLIKMERFFKGRGFYLTDTILINNLVVMAAWEMSRTEGDPYTTQGMTRVDFDRNNKIKSIRFCATIPHDPQRESDKENRALRDTGSQKRKLEKAVPVVVKRCR